MNGVSLRETPFIFSTHHALHATRCICYTFSMNPQKIETFEYDIVDELKNKKSDWVDIAKLDETKEVVVVKKTDTGKIILITLSVILFIALAIFLMLSLTKPKQVAPLTQENVAPSNTQATLQNILPVTNNNVGRFVSSVSLINNGYAIKLSDFSPVYAYVLQNESSFGKELQNIFNIEQSTSTEPFKDITLANQDMRVLTTENGTVVYAFIGNQALVLSTSTEGILTIRSVILSR